MEVGATLLQKVILSIGLVSVVICLVHMIDKDIMRNRGKK